MDLTILFSEKGFCPITAIIALMVSTMATVLLATPYYPLALVPGIGLLFFSGLVRRPQAGFFVLLFSIPFGAYRGLQPPYDFIDLPWIIALGLLVILCFSVLSRKRFSESSRSGFWTLLMIFFTVNLVSAFLSPLPGPAFKNLLLLAAASLYIILTLAYVTQDQLWSYLPKIFVASISLTSFLACIGYMFNIALFAENVYPGGFKRGIGGTTDPNNLALLILFVVPFLSQGLCSAKTTTTRITYTVLSVINLMALTTTFSRSGALVLAFLAIVSIVEHKYAVRPKHIGFILFGTAAAIMILAATMPEGYIERQLSLASKTDQSLNRRTSYLHAGWDIVVRHPVLGMGPGTFKEIYAGSIQARQFTKEGASGQRHAHNSYLEILVGTGLSGLVMFLVILGKTLSDFSKVKRYFAAAGDTTRASMVSAYRLAFLAILIYFLFLSDTLNKYLLLFIALSQIMVQSTQISEKSGEQT